MKTGKNIQEVRGAPPKQQVFGVPEGYFDSFPGRLKERLEAEKDEQVPHRRLSPGSLRRVAMAAALAGAVLLSIPLLNRLGSPDSDEDYADLALLDAYGIFGYRSELDLFLASNEEVLEDEEAYTSQAIEYLAMNDVEMDLIFE